MHKFQYKWNKATDHAIVSFAVPNVCKRPARMNRFIYDYNKGDFKGLRSSLRAANLSNIILPHVADINDNWRCWKELQQMQSTAHH